MSFGQFEERSRRVRLDEETRHLLKRQAEALEGLLALFSGTIEITTPSGQPIRIVLTPGQPQEN